MSLLENMRTFVRVVDMGNLSAAGRSLRMSPAVVSHRIQQLEQHLGVRLLNRTTRQLQPTEHGHIFYRDCLEVLDAVERAETNLASATGVPSGSLRVTAPLGFGRRVLGPMIPRFREAYPLVDVRLRLSDHLIDLLHEAVDVAIRMAVLRDSAFVVRKIADCPRVLCAAPAYLDAAGEPERPEDLAGHNCLLLRFPGSQQYQWSLNTPEGPAKVAVTGSFDADYGDVLTDWLLDGQGIAMKPVWEVAGHLRSGALRVVLPDFPPEPAVLAVLYPHRTLLPAKARAFADFVVTETRAALADVLDYDPRA
ncbi:LysR family transcriptional regulator [Skermanella rosea]|uniref:LysR family transcriptional regulator n=1 Tax=Skermanella rosea TaxID=1817965 RepID=UPI001931B3C0|nr:LysR family transcriptional regulator [Skermanella rosea]UEM05802.1 LysR family transcriptional regulator [Skermanella rosea]